MDTNKKTILIVEDEISLRDILCKKFIREGFIILEANNGKEGLEVALREHPDLILLDIMMPVMDGVTMLKKLSEDEWGKDVKVIMLTNLSDAEQVAEAMAHGSHDYLVKCDWKIEDMVKKVKEQLSN